MSLIRTGPVRKPHRRNQSLNENSSSSASQEIYARLANERIVFLSENITKDTSSSLSALLLHYDAEDPNQDVKIYINSNGGDVTALANIYDVMQMITCPIQTICIGKAYSAAAVLLSAGTPGKRFATKHADVMIHGIQASFPQSEGADHLDSEIEMEMLDNYNKMIMTILSRHTKKSVEQSLLDCSRDFFMDAKEALAYGMIDHIL